MIRRETVCGGVLCFLMMALALGAEGELTFCAVSDLHYGFPIPDFDHAARLKRIIGMAKQEKCDFFVSAGDFGIPAAQKMFAESGIPLFHALGNHETDNLSAVQASRNFGMPNDYYSVDRGGVRLIFLNTNYVRDTNGAFHVVERGNLRRLPGAVPALAPEQMAWLRDTVQSSRVPCIIVGHHSFAHGLAAQADEFRALIREMRGKPGKIILWIGGHEHVDRFELYQGCGLLTLNSASYYWSAKKHDRFGAETHAKYRYAGNMLIYEDPLYAVITVGADGAVKVKGSRSTWRGNVSPAEIKVPCDADAVVPEVRDRNIPAS